LLKNLTERTLFEYWCIIDVEKFTLGQMVYMESYTKCQKTETCLLH
jgi:hypothetical protein